jgi:hypothetical protein
MNPIEIPKSFYLFAEKIQVEISEAYFGSEHLDALGFCSYRENKVYLRPSTPGYPLAPDQIEQTFLHELMHLIIYYAQGMLKDIKDVHYNEDFVNLCASLLHQALATMEF